PPRTPLFPYTTALPITHTGLLEHAAADRAAVARSRRPARHRLRATDRADLVEVASTQERHGAVHEPGPQPVLGEGEAGLVAAREMVALAPRAPHPVAM